MKSLSILSIILISLFALNSSQIVEQTVNNVTVSAISQGGVFEISSVSMSNDTELETITIQILSLVERDENGTAISDPNHSYTSLSNVDFNVTPFQNTSMSNVTSWYSHMTAVNLPGISNNFSLVIQAQLYSEEGKLDDLNEFGRVGPGYVLFGFNVLDWSFCQNTTETPCLGNQVGSFLDLSFIVNGSENANHQHGLKYKIGESQLLLSKNSFLEYTGEVTALPTGFPQYQSINDTDVFTVRFPIFEQDAYYESLLVMDTVKLSHTHTWLVLAVIVAILLIAIVVFIVIRCFKSGRRQEALMP